MEASSGQEPKTLKDMKVLIRFFLIFSFIFQIGILLGQVSLQVLEEELKDKNPTLRALNQEYLAASELGKQAWQLQDMEVNMHVFVNPVETRLGPQQFQLGVRQFVPWKGQFKAEEELWDTKAAAKFEHIEEKQLDLMYNLEVAYLNIYALQKKLDIIIHNVHIHAAMESLSLTSIENGTGLASDVLIIQIKREELINEVEILRNRMAIYQAEINQLLHRNSKTPIETVDTLYFALLPWNRSEIKKEIEETSPELRGMDLDQKIAQKSVALSKIKAKPDLGFGLDYIFVGDRQDLNPANNGRDIIAPKISLRLPLSKQEYQTERRVSALEIAAIEDHKESTKDHFKAVIDKGFTLHKEARLKLNLVKRQKQLLEAAIELVETEYSTSGQNFEKLLQLHHKEMELELLQIDAIVLSHLAKAGIERYIGNKK